MIDIRQLLSEKEMHAFALMCAKCDSIVFYYLRMPTQAECFSSELAVYPDGSRPSKDDLVICLHCRNSMHSARKMDIVKITDKVRNMLDAAYIGKI